MSNLTTRNVVDGFGNRITLDETGITVQNAKGDGFHIAPNGTMTALGATTFPSGGVTSFKGRVGAVVPASTDYDDASLINLQLGDGTSVILFTTASGEIQIEDGSGGSVITLDGLGGVQVTALTQLDLAAPTVQVNGSPIVAPPTFVDGVTPTTFNTNADYDLPSNPNPLDSLQVFINSEAVPKAGCDRLLVQGVDYSLIAGTHGANARIHYLVTPTATNTIRAWYRT